MGAFDDLIPKNSGGAFSDLIPNAKDDSSQSFASKIKNYGLSTLSALGSGASELESGVGSFLQAPAANTLSAVINTGALLDRGYTDLSNAIGKGDPNFEQKKYNQDLQENAQRVSAFAAESRAENSRSNPLSKLGKFIENDGRDRSESIDSFEKTELPELVSQQQEISDAKGFVDTTAASVSNPLALSHTLAKSLPGLAVGLGVGRVVAGRVLASGSVLAESAAARVAAAGGDVAAQEAAAKAAIDAVQAQATRAASTAGIGSEAATSGLSSRESSYTQVKQTPFEKLSESPRFNDLVKQTGDLEKSREMLANEVADSTPILSAGLTGLGTVVTNKLYGGDATAKVLSGVEKPGLKAVIKDIGQEGAEEVIQGVPQGYSDHRAIQLADPNKEFDLGAEIAQNALGGIALGGAGHGAAYAKQKINDARVGVADAIKNRYENNISKTISPDAPIEPSNEVQLTEPEKALANPKVITPLDRVNEIDVNLKKLSPENGYGEVFDQERSDLLNERASILQSFPRLQEGAPTSFSTEDGAKLNGRYALIDANDLQTSHDIDLRENPNYPPELQPRERERAASAAQISGIVQKIDPARLGASADAGTGAPIIGADGLVESGNARSIALKRIYRVPGQKAEDYKAYLTANAAQFGIDPVQIEQLQNPVLVRVRDTPVDRAEFARQANASTVARLSSVEQARADAKRLDVLDDLSPNDSGDFSNSTNFISRFIAKVPQTERGELVDADGKLSSSGYARVRNAVLAKAYGDSPVLLRLTESLNDNLRNVSKALLQVAPKVAQVRASIKDGNLHDADITPDLLSAVEEFSRIKNSGQSVSEYLNQNDIFGDNTSSESKELLQFLNENIRRPKQIAEFILRYNEALESIGNPKQADIFNENATPEKSDLLNLAKRDNNDQPIIEQGRNQESTVPAGQDGVERADQGSDQESNPSDQTTARGEGQGVVGDGATNNLDSSKNIGSHAIIGSDNGDQSGSFSSVDLRKKNVSPSENFSKNVPASNSVEEGNGEVKDQTETKNFKKWFSGSKVVDDNGNPLPMYHGTNKNQDGDAFKIFDAYGSNYGLFGNGQYFTDNPYVASSYTDKGKGSSPSVYKVFLSIKNPINMDVEADPNLWKDNFKDVNFDEFEPRSNTNESYYRAVEDYLTSKQIPLHDGAEIIQDGLRSMGYDGIQHIGGGRVKSEGIKHKVFIAFDPEQIKSATGNNGNFDTNNPDIRFKTIDENRNYLIGISTDSLREKVKSITDQWKNSPKANIVETPSDLPFAAPNDARGAYYNGEIYLVASNIHSEHDAEIVLFHEALGHAGLRGAFGESLTPSLRKLAIDNLSIAKAAAEWRTKNKVIRGKRSEDQWLTTSVEEVLANIAESGKPIKGFDQFLSKVQSVLRAVGLNSVADWIGKHTNAEVARLLTGARKYIISGNKSHVLAGEEAKAYSFDPSADKSAEIALDEISQQLRDNVSTLDKDIGGDKTRKQIFYSRSSDGVTPSSNNQTADRLTVKQRADAIIKKSAATPAPIDAVVKAAVKISQIDKVTIGIYDGAGFILDRYTPETIKAGVISDYGVPEAVIDRRTVLSAHINVQTRKIGKFVDQLSSLTRQESRVAYEWLSNKDPQALAYFEKQLPKESVAVLSDIKKSIDDLSKEAISLGLLSQEAYDKNAFEYLHRSYVKHTFEQYKGDEKKRARAISILGDQYKGRGLSEIASMQQIENVDPAWWNRKLQEGKADKQLKGEKFIRLEKYAASGEGTIPLDGIGDRPKGKLQSVAYYPANETIPTKYAEWSQAGTYEVRDIRGGNVILWRDFTKQEREKMGEIDEARYAIANTLHSMVNDIETAKYLEWINKKYGFVHPEQVPGKIVEAKELSLTTFGAVYKPGDWVQVPDTKIEETRVKKYGALAGKYIPGPIWNDIRQIGQGSFKPFGETYSTILRLWKTSKTALSPAVHTNNVMSNFVMADWHDVSAGHIHKALRIILGAHDRDGTGVIGRAGNAAARLGIVDRDAAKEILARYQDSGGNIGTYASKELQNEQIQPLLDAIEREMAENGESPNAQVGVMNALQFLRHGEISAAYQAAIGSKGAKAVGNEARNLIDLYQSEDNVFRLAAWLKAKEDGATDIEAGKKARKSFLDYNINAPWVSALRSTAWPFVAYTYRAIPMLAEIAAKRPWKIFKLAAIAGGLNALGYSLSGGDEDDERRYLPEEKSGRIWGMVPKLIRIGWNDKHDQPIFLDIRRFIPVGDVFDIGQGHSVVPIPPAMMPGGPLVVLGEALLNKSSFTGKSITLETDTSFEKLMKTGDYLYKAVAPNIALLPGTYSYENIANAGKGKTDTFGRELSVNQALLNSVGIKIGSYGQDTLTYNYNRKLDNQLREIDANINALSREYGRKGLTYDEFIEKVTKQQDKKKAIIEAYRAK